MNLVTDVYIKGKKARLEHRLKNEEGLDDHELLLLIQLEILEKVSKINSILEQKEINEGRFPG